MNRTRLLLCQFLYIILVGPYSVAAAPMTGSINIRGMIVEPPCSAKVSADLTLKLQGCPLVISAGNMLEVKRVATVTRVATANDSSVEAKLITNKEPPDTEHGQEYVLIDAAGETIRTGSYVVTINYP
ncbi:hypothetical protein [Pseudomonas sp. M30-35]|uniref:hypothetical protein n=1 Tax=Pseudomonas sp. M30-35 TaxID=1981174 RepID=UPI000B3C13BA|nr:hypothetical protein [Pseudomonas sp. M30-35]ARU86489.1 hypothetical protein B9K09_00085 [Pseudomonas sp. M30-35]